MRLILIEALIFSPVPAVFGPLWALIRWQDRRMAGWLTESSKLELPS